MAAILLVYSTTDGHTRRISERLRSIYEQHGHRVTLVSVLEAARIDVNAFDRFVLGASVRYGTHGKAIEAFIRAHEQTLNSRPNAFFSVNVVARKPEKRQPDTNPYVQKFLQQVSWRPQAIAVFAGKLNYPAYRFWDRIMIQLIMKMTHGPTDPKTVIEYTDWNQVEEFGRLLAKR